MTEIQRMHRRKVRRRVQDFKARGRVRKTSGEHCVAKTLPQSLFKTPLDFSKIEIPTAYED